MKLLRKALSENNVNILLKMRAYLVLVATKTLI